MGVVRDRGWFYWVKRVPKRYEGLVLGVDGQPVKQVRQALHTDSIVEARTKAATVESARMAEWEALKHGDGASARKHYEAARHLATERGFSYRPMSNLVSGPTDEIVARLLSLTERGALASPAVTEAVLGAVAPVLPTLQEVLIEYYDLTTTRHTKKSDRQRHRWKLPRDRAVKNFIDVTSPATAKGKPIPRPLNEITRADAVKFRMWWSDRIAAGAAIESANKDIGHLSEIFRTWCKLTDNESLTNPFAGLRLEGNDEKTRPAFSPDWVKGKLLAPGALDGLNDEARDIFLMTFNTALRPSEITDAPLSDFELTGNVPFLRVAPHGRELKVAHTRRDIPLLGVSLEAARRIVARGGIMRYAHNAGSWSSTVNKFMAENGLRETPGHTAYSIRHYVENALLAAKIDDRVRADILGHKYHRPSYGDGGALIGRRDALLEIAVN